MSGDHMPDDATVRSRFFNRAPERTPILNAAEQSGSAAVLRLYDVIDSWGAPFGVSAREFASTIDALPDGTDEIRLHVNSPGGEATEAVAMVNTLRAHDAKVTVIVDGLAASAASFLAASADETVMMPNSELMIHDAWGIAIGPAADMLSMSARLNQVSDNIASIYAAKAGTDADAWRAAMAAETWYSAQEAVDAGLADSVSKADGLLPGPQAKNRFDLSVFNYAGRGKAPTPQTPVASASGASTQHQEGSPAVAFSDEGTTTLRQQLGVSEDADEATILAALTEALAERAEPEPQTTTPTALPEGIVAIDQTSLDALRADARRGAQAHQAQLDKERDDTIMAAVKAGKTTPARREHWAKAWDADPEGTKSILASLEPGLVPVAEAGHDEANETNEADPIFAAIIAGHGLTEGATNG